MPDSDQTVLIHHPDEDDPVWMGYHDGEHWRTVEGARCCVSHWSPLPEPPPALGAAPNRALVEARQVPEGNFTPQKMSPSAAAVARVVWATLRDHEMTFLEVIDLCAVLLVSVADKGRVMDYDVASTLERRVKALRLMGERATGGAAAKGQRKAERRGRKTVIAEGAKQPAVCPACRGKRVRAINHLPDLVPCPDCRGTGLGAAAAGSEQPRQHAGPRSTPAHGSETSDYSGASLAEFCGAGGDSNNQHKHPMTPQEAILKLNDLQKQIIHDPVFGDIAKVIWTLAEDHAKKQADLRAELAQMELERDMARGALAVRRKENEALEASVRAARMGRDTYEDSDIKQREAYWRMLARAEEAEEENGKLRGHLAFAAELLADGVKHKTCEEDAKWRLCVKGLLASVERDRCLCGGLKDKAWHLVCGACWAKLPVEMRDEVFAALNEGEGSNRHLIAKDACMDFLWAAGVALKPLDEEPRKSLKR